MLNPRRPAAGNQARRRPMTVRAKFVCMSKLEVPVWGNGGYDSKVTKIDFNPVFASGAADGGNAVEENRIFGKNTPSGSISMTIANQAAADGFETGKSYYVDFTPAD
jgi:hypothetical protein